MKIDLNKLISGIILLTGHILFVITASSYFSVSVIILVSMFLLWMIWCKATDTFDLNTLLFQIGFSGTVVSILIIALFGIEPVGTRTGILVRFHSIAIAIAMGSFLLSVLPYIVLKVKFKLPLNKLNINVKPWLSTNKSKIQKSEEVQYIVGDGNWELASEADILSSKYNIE